MKKVLVLTQYDNDGTYFYRLKPLFHINHPEIKIERKPYMGEINYSFFDGYNVLVMERPSGVQDLNCIKLAKQCGLTILTDWDDDCLHLDNYNPMWHHYEQCKSVLMECIALSDEVWVSTTGIKQSFKLLNKNIHVLPNCHNDYLMPIANKKAFNPNTKKAIWRGGGSHEADVYENAEKIVDTINANTDWQFQFLGFRFIYLEQRCGDNYLPVSLMPLMQYYDYMRKENPQVVIHPLSTNKFNVSKSNISLLESTYAGAAFFGNRELPEFDFDFVWHMKYLDTGLERYPEVLAKTNKQAWQYICDELLLSNINKQRVQRLLSL